MTLEEYREAFLNYIETTSIIDQEYPENIFLKEIEDILAHDYKLLSQLDPIYFDLPYDLKTAKKGMHINGGYFEESANTLHLVSIDYNPDEFVTMQKADFEKKLAYLKNFFEAVLSGYFKTGERASEVVQFAASILGHAIKGDIYKINYIIATTNKFSGGCKTISSTPLIIGNTTFEVDVTSLDMEAIFKTKLSGFKKEPVIINTSDFGLKGIPCIKADLKQNKYDAYLAIIPGEFLSDIYKKFNSRLLEDNVRSFLNFRGGVNKGIRATILNEKNNFFAFNNGISATASEVEVNYIDGEGYYITELTDFQIINGGQTTASLAATSIKDKADLSGIYVQMKLTIVRELDENFIINVAKYANSQNKVTSADLNSNHKFYVRMEEFSRKLYTPKIPGLPYQTKWFFERSRGQYDQQMMQLTKAKVEAFKNENPTSQKMTKTDIAKYLNSAEMHPYEVSWGAEVNATKFFAKMEKEWETDDNKFNELYFKRLVGKALFFKHIENLISNQDWYQERNGYRAQLVTYTFSKIVYEVSLKKLVINYLEFWNKQSIPSAFDHDLCEIAKICFDQFYNPSIANVSSYCKKQECWNVIKKIPFTLSDSIFEYLNSLSDVKVEDTSAKKEQRNTNKVTTEIAIFNLGENKWKDLLQRGFQQKVLNPVDENFIQVAIKYCRTGFGCSSKQAKCIWEIKEKLSKNGIE